jgi:biopolymer transport protein ExbB
MDIVETFVDFALLGAAWVLWLLVGLSILSIGVMIDRALWFRRRDLDTEDFIVAVRRAWRAGQLEELMRQHRGSSSVPVRVALAGLAERGQGADAMAEAMQAERTRWRKAGENHLIILGTLGNNAPFVGLFGTVLGIIGALHVLSGDASAGDTAVMGELSEALVATAIGLLVAIPAVIAYNLFQRRLKVILSSADEAGHAVLGLVYGGNEGAARPEAG